MRRLGVIAWSLAASAIALPSSASAAGPYYLLRFNQLSTTAPTGFTPFTIPFTFVGQTAYWAIPADYDEGPGAYTLVYFGSGGTATANMQVDLYGSAQANCSTVQVPFESFTGTYEDSRTTGGTIAFNRPNTGVNQSQGLNLCLRLTILSLTGTVVLGYDDYQQQSMIALPSSGYDGGVPVGGGGSGADSGTGPGSDGGGGIGPGQIAFDVGCDCSQGANTWPVVASIIALASCLRARRAR